MLQTRVVGRYDDIDAALHDPDTFSSAPTVPDPPSPWRERFAGRVPTRGTLLGLDNPDHDRLRVAVNTFFMPRRLARYEPWIRDRAYRLVDGFVKDGQTNLRTSFALPLALQVISHVVGLDADRWEWIGAALGFILGSRDIHHPGTPEEKAQLLPDLHDHILEVMTERRRKRRDDLISHVWEQRDAGVVEMTDFEMLSLFPGPLPAGHETSSNLICTGLSHPLADPTRYAGAQRDDDSRAAALEELFRYESAITGMRRLVTRDTMLAGVPLRTGEQLFLAYASGSRDARRFAAPDEIDLDRSWAAPHLGFGQGVHACLGAPLARLLLRIELGVLHERLPNLRVAVPYDELQRTVVPEGRGMVALPLAWTPVPVTARTPAPVTDTDVARAVPVTVTSRRALTPNIVELTLVADAPGDVPEWEPGAHIDLELPDGALRQYSLCGRRGDAELRIAVLREDDGRGGSLAVHDRVGVGNRLRIRGPPQPLPAAPRIDPAVRRRRHRHQPVAADDRRGRAPGQRLAPALPRARHRTHGLPRRAERPARTAGRGVAQPRPRTVRPRPDLVAAARPGRLPLRLRPGAATRGAGGRRSTRRPGGRRGRHRPGRRRTAPAPAFCPPVAKEPAAPARSGFLTACRSTAIPSSASRNAWPARRR